MWNYKNFLVTIKQILLQQKKVFLLSQESFFCQCKNSLSDDIPDTFVSCTYPSHTRAQIYNNKQHSWLHFDGKILKMFFINQTEIKVNDKFHYLCILRTLKHCNDIPKLDHHKRGTTLPVVAVLDLSSTFSHPFHRQDAFPCYSNRPCSFCRWDCKPHR
jgi:hypothetical protein